MPIFQGEEADLAALQELADEHRPLNRGECCEEARPCPWVSCKDHIYFDRFEEFESVIAAIPESASDAEVEGAVTTGVLSLFDAEYDGDTSRLPKTAEEVVALVRKGRAMVTDDDDGRVRSDVLTGDDVHGPWPTCSLDVADSVRDGSGEMSGEDTARVLAVTREAVRLIEERSRPYFARHDPLRPWLLEFVSEERLSEIEVDWYGEG